MTGEDDRGELREDGEDDRGGEGEDRGRRRKQKDGSPITNVEDDRGGKGEDDRREGEGEDDRGGEGRMTEGTSVEDDRKESLELADPAHFHEVTFEVEQLRVGFAHLVGKRDLGAEPEHRDRAVEQRGLQDAGLVLAGAELSGYERKPPAS